MKRIGILGGIACLGLSLAASGWSYTAGSSAHLQRAPHITKILTVTPLGHASPESVPLWSPSGRLFGYNVSPTSGHAVIGLAPSFKTYPVNLGPGRHLVDLTAREAVVASTSDRRDWLYPLHHGHLGKPTVWKAATDTWQEWVNTQAGPAIVTGGYQPKTVALTESTGIHIPLSPSQVFVSPDGEYGAAVGGQRLRRNVDGGQALSPSLYQPSPVTGPIILWAFDAATPHVIATIHLPKVHLTKAARGAYVGYIAFSLNNRYLAVSVAGNSPIGDRLIGKTFIYRVRTGTLVGVAPYGNGMMWAIDSRYLWLGTPLPQGQGTDKLVNVRGKSVWSWSTDDSPSIGTGLSGKSLIVLKDHRLGVWNKQSGFHALSKRRMTAPVAQFPAPSASAILMNDNGEMIGCALKH
ncbi:MAG: hypothetical protein C7B45_04435 [Sulfobacillus acidophilus]|uniref:Uncharacterized protein n=1 Tax=Sulfobacillus acidophilus TaxID=53633 RepID=A0A2T2WLB8_9FIRM|nr:MAG: hypothetical protein C7B45_04435 [Sulfobacillus acidophilus]